MQAIRDALLFDSEQTYPGVRSQSDPMGLSSVTSSSVWRLTFAHLLVQRMQCSIERGRIVAAMIQPQLGLLSPAQAIDVLCADAAMWGAVRKQVA